MSIDKKAFQLGMPFGTACNKLRKQILFSLIQELNRDICFQCHTKIDTIDQLSIEHKTPWMDSEDPKEKFWNLGNIAFSHISCNVAVGRKPPKIDRTLEEKRARWRDSYNKNYTTEKRRRKYDKHGY